MSRIYNEAKVKNPLIVGIREQLEHRALWMYLLCDEAEKHGLKAEDFAPDAIKRCGLYQGKNLVEKGKRGQSLKGLKKALFGFFAQKVFEMDILRCDDHQPAAWRNQIAAFEQSCKIEHCRIRIGAADGFLQTRKQVVMYISVPVKVALRHGRSKLCGQFLCNDCFSVFTYQSDFYWFITRIIVGGIEHHVGPVLIT